MAQGPAQRSSLGQTLLPAVPPWDGIVVVPEEVVMARGDAVRVRLRWTDDGRIEVLLDLVQWGGADADRKR